MRRRVPLLGGVLVVSVKLMYVRVVDAVGWGGEMGPSNPFFGHALERSWPVIFSASLLSSPLPRRLEQQAEADPAVPPRARADCTDPGMADRCGDDVYDKEACQCRDW